MLIGHFTGSRSLDLCQMLIDWFYVSGQLVLTSLREVNNLEFDFNCKWVQETVVKN